LRAGCIITLSVQNRVFKWLSWFLIIQILMIVFLVLEHVHILLSLWDLLRVSLLVHVLFNHLWIVKGLSKYVIVNSGTIIFRYHPRWKIVWRPKFLFNLILLHEPIHKVLIDRRWHLELGFSWNYLMNRFFVIVSRLITHHIKITHHALTRIALAHFYFPKK
jgi:hypothetical protein